MSTKKLSLRLATHAMIAGLAFSSAGFAAVELAAPAVAQGDAETNPANINPDAVASLTIYKKLNPGTRNDPTGKVDPNVTGTALENVTFEITRLDYDLTTFAGLEAARKATPDNASVDQSFSAVSKTTDSEGKIVFDGLSVGAYLVKETQAPEGVVKSAPFIVFLPMTDVTERNGWLYDVVAYPKNTKTTIDKQLGANASDKEANVGDYVHYTVTADRPAIDPARSYVKSYVIYDSYTSNLAWQPTDGQKAVVKLGETVLVEGVDYNIQNDATANRVGVVFTKEGATKLTLAENGTKVTVDFPFLVVASDDNSVINVKNTAGMKFDLVDRESPVDPGTDPTNPTDPDPWEPTDPIEPTDPVTPGTDETWVPVKINKVDSADSSKKLQGATFQVYKCTKADGAPGLDAGTKAELVGQPLTVNNESSWITDQQGAATINALRLVKEWNETQGYCLVETKAPNGYELLPSPYFFRVTSDSKDALVAGIDVKNINSNDNGFHLPATGGMGVGLLMALGAAVAGAGVVYARRTSRS